MSDEQSETNDNSITRDDDLASGSSASAEADAQPQRARAGGGRFRSGQSGNPRGRPRKAPEPFHAMTARVLNEPVALTLGGQRVEMVCAEAIFRAMCHKAMKDPRMGREVFRYLPEQASTPDLGETRDGLLHGEAAFENLLARLRRQIIAESTPERATASDVGDNDNPQPAAEPEDAS
ncbi:DUF5681 domain-containing protein [Methylobacterium sp. E-065]|uniref:DUF5681 domain-containing protein n=1 Tax=Methylobacterium sp. E-065 TaxID=2836583 RepID=UPI001FBAF4B8|nr:DUF5681 domain-containing protein [Methylobacterium sp. E-065]MCJ2017990.1 DUF5681 domain-containing protein [Methylobacterium sp. E-065]